MNKQILSTFVFALILINSAFSEYTRGDFEQCYYSCRDGFKSGVAGQTGNYQTYTQANFINKIYEYETCVLNLTLEEFIANYPAASGVVTSSTTRRSQSGYCGYFFSSSLYDASKINQAELKKLATNCFTSTGTGLCGNYLPTTVFTTAPTASTDGTSHYSVNFERCLSNCEEQTAIEALLEYQNCKTKCDNTYTATVGGGNDNTVYKYYEDCKRDTLVCGRVNALTMEDFAFKTYYQQCETACQSAYTSQYTSTNPVHAARATYFSCVNNCPIPDASSFQRLDNSVNLNANNLQFQLGLFLILIINVFLFA